MEFKYTLFGFMISKMSRLLHAKYLNSLSLTFILISLFSSVSAEPLKPSYTVENLTSFQFENLKFITDIEQDKNGFIWFATNTGLFRFDGYTLTEYSPKENNDNSLPHFHINQLLIDQKNKMWVGTTFGLAIYQDESDDFERIYLNESLLNPIITYIFEDSQENTWIGTKKNGAFKISKN